MNDVATWQRQLAEGLDAMAIEATDAQRDALVLYLDLMQRWNGVYNLTAVRDPLQMVGRHLLDSLAILSWVDCGPVLDVGTGAGLPGMPLAVLRPDLYFVLLDSNGKKTRFVQQAATELGLTNVEVVRERVEAFSTELPFTRVTSRAYATLADMVRGTAHLIAADGVWLAMKGTRPDAEIDRLDDNINAGVMPLSVPGESAPRHLVLLRRVQ